MMKRPLITPVILSGGSGTRLWPVSRSRRPKQLLALTGRRTMLQLTVERTGDRSQFADAIIVANDRHADEIDAQLAGYGGTRLILEPMARNTAPAIALAAYAVDPSAILLVMPSDHVIARVDAFRQAVLRAADLAATDWLMLLGIEPTAPETGYGYIRRGEPIAEGVNRVECFVEKPDRATAEVYIAEGGYSWNGGIFLMRAGAYTAALETYAPQIAAAAREAVARGEQRGNRFYPDQATFARSPSLSIDYAVMEKTDRAAVIPVDMGWSDVGSWDAIHELAAKDGLGNAHHGEVVAIDTSNCLIRTEGPLVAALGIKDIIVIATRDAVLVMPRGDSQQVKRAIEALEREGHVTLHEIW